MESRWGIGGERSVEMRGNEKGYRWRFVELIV